MKMKRLVPVLLLCAVLTAATTGCASNTPTASNNSAAANSQAGYSGIEVQSPDWVGKLDAAANAKQMLVVAAFDENATEDRKSVV